MDLEYLKKYNKLPKELKDRINAPSVVLAMEKIEQAYGVSLALLVIKLMIKDITLDSLRDYFITNEKFAADKADKIVKELKEKVLFAAADHLGLEENKRISLAPNVRGDLAKGDKKAPAVIENHLVKYQNHLPAKMTLDLSAKEKNKEIKPAGKIAPETQEKPAKPAVIRPEVKKSALISSEKATEQAAAVHGSSFFFAPEDEEEIRELTKKAIIGDSAPAPSAEADEKVSAIIKVAEIDFGSEFLVDRFKQILRTYVKGIRSSIDTKITLKKPFDSGGLSFDEESADKIVSLADSIIGSKASASMIKPQKITVPEDVLAGQGGAAKTGQANSLKNIGSRDVGYDFASSVKKASLKPAAGQATAINPVIKAVLSGSASVRKTEAVEAEKEALKSMVRPISETSVGKVRMDDIKYVPLPTNVRSEMQTMTPIDELRIMDLTTFRRMGQQDPFRSASKVKDKIKLLEEENYNKKTEGIKAWRSSPVNQLYLEIGEKSISENKPVDVIMAERKFSGQAFLTNLEFEAIMDLNKELRF